MKVIVRPSKKEIESRISEIKNLDLSKMEIDEIKELLKLLFTGYALTTPTFDPGIILYRGIPYKDKPKSILYLSYPPKELAKINRASRDNQPVFYCATSENVPFFELDMMPGDRLVVSKWKTTKKLLVNNVGYTESNFSKLNSNRNNQKWRNGKEEHLETQKEENLIVQDFFAKTFSQSIPKDNVDIYKLTIAIAETHFLGDLFNGLLYPTIPMKANADNFAIKPSFINSDGLLFEEVYFIEITEVHDFKYDIKRLDWANSISTSGNIAWKGRVPQWTIKEKGGELKFTAKDGKWKAQDNNGNIVEPN